MTDAAGAQRVQPECGHDFDGLVRSLGNAHDLAERQAAESARLEARLRAVEEERDRAVRDIDFLHERHQAEARRLQEELEDSNAAYRAVMDEACQGGVTYGTDDRLHCTCVPHLREGVKALREALAGTHFHHKAFEPLCRLCQEALAAADPTA